MRHGVSILSSPGQVPTSRLSPHGCRTCLPPWACRGARSPGFLEGSCPLGGHGRQAGAVADVSPGPLRPEGPGPRSATCSPPRASAKTVCVSVCVFLLILSGVFAWAGPGPGCPSTLPAASAPRAPSPHALWRVAGGRPVGGPSHTLGSRALHICFPNAALCCHRRGLCRRPPSRE